MKTLPTLKIGKLSINPPFILGGMGVRSSDHPLVAAVANCGMAGTIASVGLVQNECRGQAYVEASNEGLFEEIRKARALTKGPVGVNIMVALTNYDELVKTAVKAGVDYIISGAGLPLNLPTLAKGSDVCLIPVVSSARTAEIICKRWLSRDDRLPDAVVVEGAMAGGHLGYSLDEVSGWGARSLETICSEVIAVCKKYEEKIGKHIPVIAAGGVFDGSDIARLLKIGVEGVQMATRFLATDECTLPRNCKQLILDSKKEDMAIIKSPVGMPGRAIRNELVRRVERGEKLPISCPYHCLRTCSPGEASFCIADALIKAHKGDAEFGLLMAGANAYRIKEIVPVKKLIDDLVAETLAALEKDGDD
ncbi:MAG TPA: nitronate monooxygenase family protein [Armatimonadota bacterium]|jgi:NAD(P)H-dependent flavin oxidoreductase YrpB (nitropropane dioxygenase family)